MSSAALLDGVSWTLRGEGGEKELLSLTLSFHPCIRGTGTRGGSSKLLFGETVQPLKGGGERGWLEGSAAKTIVRRKRKRGGDVKPPSLAEKGGFPWKGGFRASGDAGCGGLESS